MTPDIEDKPKADYRELWEQPLGDINGNKFFRYDQYISTGKAAKRAGVTIPTITKWIKIHDIGWRIAGHWKVLPGRLEALLKRLEDAGEFPFDERTLAKKSKEKNTI